MELHHEKRCEEDKSKISIHLVAFSSSVGVVCWSFALNGSVYHESKLDIYPIVRAHWIVIVRYFGISKKIL